MKRFLPLLLFLAAVAAGALPARAFDESAAAFRTSSPWGVSAFAAWDRLDRELGLPEGETLKSDAFLAGVAFRPTGWSALYAFAGASTMKLDHWAGDPDLGFAGGAGADVSVWQIDDGDDSFWRVVVKLTGRYLHRQSDDDKLACSFSLNEFRVALPVAYEIAFSERSRLRHDEIFTGLEFAAGPVASWLDGELEHDVGGKEDLEEKDTVGLYLGAAMLFGESWRLGAEGMLAGDLSGAAYVRYDF